MKRPGLVILLLMVLFGVFLLPVLPVLAQDDESLDESLPADEPPSTVEAEAEPVPLDEPPQAMPAITYKPGKKLVIDGIVQSAVNEDDGQRMRIELQSPADRMTYILLAEGNSRGLGGMIGSSVQVEGRFLEEQNGKPVLTLTSYQVNLPPDNSPTPPPPPEEPEYTEPPADDGGNPPPPDEGGETPPPVDDEG